jgi:hypothetical protein
MPSKSRRPIEEESGSEDEPMSQNTSRYTHHDEEEDEEEQQQVDEPSQTQADVDIDYTDLKSGSKSRKRSRSSSSTDQHLDSDEKEALIKMSLNHYHIYQSERRPQLKKEGKLEPEIKLILKSEWSKNDELQAKYKNKLNEMIAEIKEKYPHLQPKPRAKAKRTSKTGSTTIVEGEDGQKREVKVSTPRRKRSPSDQKKTICIDFRNPPKLENPLFAFKAPKVNGKSVTGVQKRDLYKEASKEVREECEKKVKDYRVERSRKIAKYIEEDKQYLENLGITVK